MWKKGEEREEGEEKVHVCRGRKLCVTPLHQKGQSRRRDC